MGWVLIRADASVLIGSGHVMRCLSLANALQENGKFCVFAARHLPTNLADKLRGLGHRVVALQGDGLPPPEKAQGQYGEWLGTSERADADTLLSVMVPFVAEHGAPDFIVCDHYGLSVKWETRVGENLQAPIAVIDDLSNREHDCQWLIDTTYGKTAKDYEGLIPENCHTFIGSEYALLRPEFSERRPKALVRRDDAFAQKQPVRNVLISMGGMDKDNVSQLMLEAIVALPAPVNFETHVLVGPNCPNLSALRSFAKTMPFDVTIHGGVSDVTPLFMGADLCIGAAGSSTWERCCLGLPTINIVIADNQKTIAHQMSSRGALIDAGMFMQLDIKKFSTEILHPCLSSHEQRKALSIVCRDICDGHGVGYIVEALEICSVKHDKIISLRRAHSDDIKTVYDWQCLPETRKFANIPQMPEWDGHVAWMGRKLRDFGCHFYIIQCDQSNAGVVRLDRKSIEDTDTFIVSIFIHPDFFGIGAASAGLSIVAKMHPTKTIFAQVHYDNTASVALFLRAGYKPQGDGWYILSPRLKQP